LEVRREWQRRNREKLRQEAWNRYRANLERNRARNRAAYHRKPKKILTPAQRQYQNEASRLFRRRHASRLREQQRQRTQNDPAFALLRLLRGRVQKAVKKQYAKKATKTVDLIGCSVSRLLQHLESQFEVGMNWQNIGRHGWHIDHVIPCAAFDLKRPDHQRRCFHFTNLRPAWEKHNLGRGSRIEGELPLIYRHRKILPAEKLWKPSGGMTQELASTPPVS